MPSGTHGTQSSLCGETWLGQWLLEGEEPAVPHLTVDSIYVGEKRLLVACLDGSCFGVCSPVRGVSPS